MCTKLWGEIGLDAGRRFWETPAPVLSIPQPRRTKPILLFGERRRSILMKITRTTLITLAFSGMLFAGCQAMAPIESHRRAPSTRQFKWQEEKGPTLGSWFRTEEPDPPKSLMDWMDLEPIRP